jgi:hypothetical protein
MGTLTEAAERELLTAAQLILQAGAMLCAMPSDRELDRARAIKAALAFATEATMFAAAVREALEDLDEDLDDDGSDLMIEPHPELEALAQVCTCGKDRGDHAAAAPHGIMEEGAGFRVAECFGFVPADRSTERPMHNVPTDPPPAMPAAEVQ